MKNAWVKEEFCRDLALLERICFLREVNKMWRKAKAFSAFLGNDKERETTTNTAEQFGVFSFRKQFLLFPQNPF